MTKDSAFPDMCEQCWFHDYRFEDVPGRTRSKQVWECHIDPLKVSRSPRDKACHRGVKK